MGYLSIQIQPDLASSISSEGVTSFLNKEGYTPEIIQGKRSEERRVGKEGRDRWSP